MLRSSGRCLQGATAVASLATRLSSPETESDRRSPRRLLLVPSWNPPRCQHDNHHAGSEIRRACETAPTWRDRLPCVDADDPVAAAPRPAWHSLLRRSAASSSPIPECAGRRTWAGPTCSRTWEVGCGSPQRAYLRLSSSRALAARGRMHESPSSILHHQPAIPKSESALKGVHKS